MERHGIREDERGFTWLTGVQKLLMNHLSGISVSPSQRSWWMMILSWHTLMQWSVWWIYRYKLIQWSVWISKTHGYPNRSWFNGVYDSLTHMAIQIEADSFTALAQIWPESVNSDSIWNIIYNMGTICWHAWTWTQYNEYYYTHSELHRSDLTVWTEWSSGHSEILEWDETKGDSVSLSEWLREKQWRW